MSAGAHMPLVFLYHIIDTVTQNISSVNNEIKSLQLIIRRYLHVVAEYITYYIGFHISSKEINDLCKKFPEPR